MVISRDEASTASLATQLANASAYTDCITLSGDLGSGKTTFARAFIQALAGHTKVQSPTFLLVIPYDFKRNETMHKLHHFDLYRIKHPSELAEIGLQEHLSDSLCLIEWPEIAEDYLPDNRLDIIISTLPDGSRELKLISKGDWQDKLNSIYF